MNLKERELLTDEELDTVVGGTDYLYERVFDKGMGDCYRLTNDDSTVLVAVNDWEDWLKQQKEKGNTVSPL